MEGMLDPFFSLSDFASHNWSQKEKNPVCASHGAHGAETKVRTYDS